MFNFTNPEQFAIVNKASIDAMRILTNTALASAERLATLNLNTVRSAMEDSMANVKAVFSARDPQEVVTLSLAQTQPAVEHVVSYNRSLYDIAAQSKDEVSRLFESQLSDMQKQVANMMDKAAKSAPAGSDVAVAAVKSAIEAANSAFSNIKNAARQATEIAELNIATASNATVKAAGAATSAKTKAN